MFTQAVLAQKKEVLSRMKIKILLIDDDQFLINLLSEVLAAADFDVHATNHSSQYEEFVNNVHPDIILLDWMMPEKSGIEVLAGLKQNPATKGIPVIMLTTKSLLNEVNQLFTAGADDYICKPFNPEIIAKQIRNKFDMFQKRRGKTP